MRGIENLYLGVPRLLWNRQCKEGHAVGRTYTEQALASIKGFKSEPAYQVSQEWGYLIEDNCEFWLKVPEERMVNGVLKTSSLLNTTTSECSAPNVCHPAPTPTPTPRVSPSCQTPCVRYGDAPRRSRVPGAWEL